LIAALRHDRSITFAELALLLNRYGAWASLRGLDAKPN